MTREESRKGNKDALRAATLKGTKIINHLNYREEWRKMQDD